MTNKRSKRIAIRLFESEVELIKKSAKDEKITISEFVRRAIAYYLAHK